MTSETDSTNHPVGTPLTSLIRSASEFEIDDFAVVGTGTGVGKTVVTAGLVGALREADIDACAIKPVQTGYPHDDDTEFVADTCGDDEAAICLRRLEPALAPTVAAEQVGETLDYDAILKDCSQAIQAAGTGIVEGVGGLRVPLAGGHEVIDLVADLDLPAVVVARPGLGTLNHSALTVQALRRRDIEVTGVILNNYTSETLAERTNPEIIAKMACCPIETLPRLNLESSSTPTEGVFSHLSTATLPISQQSPEREVQAEHD